jgi:hypothetical protein
MRLKAEVERVLSSDDPWRLGNEVLYELCERYPSHDTDEEIIAKVWLIGRSYSASIEVVPDALRKSKLDEKLETLIGVEDIDESSAGQVLDVHSHLVRLFYRLTKKNKRSLASKYLHFHRPKIFFIYDSRAAAGVRALGLPRRNLVAPRGADRTYAQFVGAALGIRNHVASQFGHKLSPRQLDRLLLAVHE